MRIKRFESINESSYLNGTWTKEKFVKITNLKSEIENEERSLLPLLKDYLLLNPDIQEEEADISEEETYVTTYSFNENSTEIFYFSYVPEDGDHENWDVNLNRTQFQDLLKFLKDPEMYKNTNKYNI